MNIKCPFSGYSRLPNKGVGVKIFLKINKRGVQIIPGGQNTSIPPKTACFCNNQEFLNFRYKKLIKGGGANKLRGVKNSSKKKKTSPPRLFGSREYDISFI